MLGKPTAKNLKNIQAKQALLVREKSDLEGKLQSNQAVGQRRDYAKRILGRDSTAVTVSPTEVAKWHARIAQIEVELRDLQSRIASSR